MIGNQLRRSDLIAELCASHPTHHALHLEFGGTAFRVSTNSAALTSMLREYFGPFVRDPGTADLDVVAIEGSSPDLPLEFTLQQPDPGKTRIKEEYADLSDGRVVRKRLTGMVFIFGGEDHLAIGPCCANPNQVVNFINNRSIERGLLTGALLGHAAGVHCGGRGLALAGFSGMGKSTLALHLVSAGADFVSNDRLLIAPCGSGVEMRGIAKYPRINPGTALGNPHLSGIIPVEEQARLRRLDPDALWDLEQKYDVPIESCFGPGRFRLATAMHGLVLLNWRRSAGPLAVRPVDLASRRDLLPAFMKRPGLFFLPPREGRPPRLSQEDYLALLPRCQVLEFSGGVDFPGATEACLRLLEGVERGSTC